MFPKISAAVHMEAVAGVERIIDSGIKKDDVVRVKEALKLIPLLDLNDPVQLEEIAAGLSSVRGKLTYSRPHRQAREFIESSISAVQAKKRELQTRAGIGHAGAMDSSASGRTTRSEQAPRL